MATQGPTPEQTAAGAPEPGILRVLRNLDLALIALALPLFLATGLPIAGWALGAGLWVLQRAIKHFIETRAQASDDTRTTVGLLTAGMIGRGWLVAGAIFAVGLASEDAGLAGAILFLMSFTISFTMSLALRGGDTRPSTGAAK